MGVGLTEKTEGYKAQAGVAKTNVQACRDRAWNYARSIEPVARIWLFFRYCCRVILNLLCYRMPSWPERGQSVECCGGEAELYHHMESCNRERKVEIEVLGSEHPGIVLEVDQPLNDGKGAKGRHIRH